MFRRVGTSSVEREQDVKFAETYHEELSYDEICELKEIVEGMYNNSLGSGKIALAEMKRENSIERFRNGEGYFRRF